MITNQVQKIPTFADFYLKKCELCSEMNWRILRQFKTLQYCMPKNPNPPGHWFGHFKQIYSCLHIRGKHAKSHGYCNNKTCLMLSNKLESIIKSLQKKGQIAKKVVFLSCFLRSESVHYRLLMRFLCLAPRCTKLLSMFLAFKIRTTEDSPKDEKCVFDLARLSNLHRF